MDEWFLISVLALDATLRVATPLVLCAMAGLMSERSGIIDISLEGKMLGAAFAAASVAAVTGSAWLGLAAAIGVGCMLALLHGFASITHNGSQVVSGVAINILMSGLTVTLGIAWFAQGGQTPALNDEARFRPLLWPRTDLMAEFGLRLRAVGENPLAVDTAGISVTWLRYRAVLCAGILSGIAGAYLSTAHNAAFVRDMTAGQGYIALAAMIFGKWRPVPAMGACLLFGFLDALADRLQGVEVPVVGEIPVQFIQVLPYVLTVVLLAGFIGRAVAPRAIGVPYVKER
jgi:simple sugar transport system permease protein